MSTTINVPKPSSCRRDRYIDVIVIGGGHSGLAMSYRLSQTGIDHVVLDAGDIGHRWRAERWDSLKLLTPNWMLDLPGMPYEGAMPPHEFMHKDCLADYLKRYAHITGTPIKRFTRVHCIAPDLDGYRVTTTQGEWHCRAVVLATGAFVQPVVPAVASELPAPVEQITARDYRNPGMVKGQRVLVVGGSATGLQFASELSEHGKEVTLAVGEHVRMPRTFAGQDIYYWLQRSGVFWETTDDVDDLRRARGVPSPQLVGGERDLDLNTLHTRRNVEVVGRLVGVSGNELQFSGNLPNLCKSADLKLGRLLKRFQEIAPDLPQHLFEVEPTHLPKPRLSINASEFDSVIWATGFKPDYSWLDMDVLDRKGHLKHDQGVVTQGLYALGLPLLRTRASTFIAGTKCDTAHINQEICKHLGAYTPALAVM